MPKVRYLSGNQTGAVVELSNVEAQCAVDTGYGELVEEKPKNKPAPRLAPKPAPVKPGR